MSDFEDDWHTLGRGPSRTERAVKSGSKKLVSAMEYLISLVRRSLEYIIGLIDRAWTEFFRTITNFDRFAALLCLTALVAAIWIGWNMSKSDGRIQYCFVDKSSSGPVIILEGYRPWHTNATLRTLKDGESVEILYETAKKLDCPMR